MVLLYKFIPQIDSLKHALFVGFFGPIGVSAVFNLGLVLEFFRLHNLDEEGDESGEVERGEKDSRPTFARMEEQIRVIVWFMVMSSIVSLNKRISLKIIATMVAITNEMLAHNALTLHGTARLTRAQIYS